MLNYYYIKLKPSVAEKVGRTQGKKYLVVAEPAADRIEFINDLNEFDAINKHECTFAGVYGAVSITKPTPEVLGTKVDPPKAKGAK